MKSGWGQLTVEEKVERLRKVVLIGMLGLIVCMVLLAVVMISTIVDESPSKPQKQERTVNHNEAGGI